MYRQSSHMLFQPFVTNNLAFDHDLGDGKDAIAVAHWLVERDMDGIPFPVDFAFEVHSGNPIGRANIRWLIDNYLEFKRRDAAAGNNVP
ncbi:hypothetical protein HFO56_00665 [Rhizobium laguerreae]|uniref:cyclic-phosphate processing receiver domain-containing protein n=1 Tax=Rhizobium laguerreae TaxID=1076926 RepID=UPI001D2DA2B3|nr:cyclic-phosphate processing receiver domain-containing protein [Rhizobium laguerreae]MBY3150941.1 hypothetical protein [Rhizobium laguerreae]